MALPSNRMTFDLCVPAYNEAEIIQESLGKMREALSPLPDVDWRMMVSDNASADGTGDRVRSLSDPRITVIRVEERGKGIAIIEAARASTSDFFGFIDADLSADPSDVLPLLSVLTRGEADIVVGSRLLDTRVVSRGKLRSISSLIFNWLRHIILGIKVADSQCGLKLMNANGRDVLRTCSEKGWFLDLEFLAKAERKGLRIREVPVHWDEQRFAGRKSKLRVVRDGVEALIAMVRIRATLS